MVKVNPYVYANDDPVNLVDPSGKSFLLADCVAGILQAIGASFSVDLAIDAVVLGTGGAGLPAVIALIVTLTALNYGILWAAARQYCPFFFG
jgi:hypothetical protein